MPAKDWKMFSLRLPNADRQVMQQYAAANGCSQGEALLHYFRLGVEASNPDKLSAAATKADIAALGAALKSAIENQPIQIQRQLEEKREEEPQEHDDWKSKPLLARILKK